MSTLSLEDERTLESEVTNIVAFAVLATLGFVSLWVIQAIWPGLFPIEFFSFWKTRGDAREWLLASWPLFLWGVAVTTLASMASVNFIRHNKKAEGIFGLHALMSLRAGFFEEVTYRWLYFFGGILTAKFTNFCFFGWLGFGIPQWFQVNLAGPVANFVTLGALGPVFSSPANWVLGAAILSANAAFRDGHKYLGFFGVVNSWFCGMFFFVLLFKYGLLACILVHFLYDLAIGVVRYVDMAVERQLGWGKGY